MVTIPPEKSTKKCNLQILTPKRTANSQTNPRNHYLMTLRAIYDQPSTLYSIRKPTSRMTPTLGFILGSFALLALAGLLRIRALPRIKDESSFTSPAKAWVDLWLPLVAVIPLVCSIAIARSLAGSTTIYPVWYAVAPATIIAGLGIGLLFIFSEKTSGLADEDGFLFRHASVLSILGLIISIASLSDRITLPQGEMLIVASTIWIWLNSPTHEARHNSSGTTNDSKTQKHPRLILDWSGTLRKPIPFQYKLAVFGLLCVFGLAVYFFLNAHLRETVSLAVGFQGVLGFLIWRSLGRACARRFLQSTLVFSILLGLGAATVSRLYMNLNLPFLPESWLRLGPSELLGMSSLRATGLFLIGLGIVAFLYSPSPSDAKQRNTKRSFAIRKTIGLATAIPILIGSCVLTLTGSAYLVNDAGNCVARAADTIIQWFHSDENGAGSGTGIHGDSFPP